MTTPDAPRPHSSPLMAVVVVHWRNEEQIHELLESLPEDSRFELVVVDNSSSLGPLPAGALRFDPGTNLGFAGGANLGWRATRAPWVLFLNPDARPRPGALESMADAILQGPDSDGLIPALEDPDGTSQSSWQLRPLPTLTDLLLQTLFLSRPAGLARPPAAGALIEQPAAAALALRRSALEEVDGFDERFHPAWFEDVDLARRLARAGKRLRYLPSARFEHEMGTTVPVLGYGRFLSIYYRNHNRYLRLHHGRFWAVVARLLLPKMALARLLLLPLRKPRRAGSRREAARGLLDLARGAVRGWKDRA